MMALDLYIWFVEVLNAFAYLVVICFVGLFVAVSIADIIDDKRDNNKKL